MFASASRHYCDRGQSRQAGSNGFTLIEIIMAISLASVLGLFTIQFVSQAARTTQLTRTQKDLVDAGKLAMEYMVRELRVASAKNNPFVVTTTSIKFDKLTSLAQDTNKCRIEYSYSAGTLKRTTHTGSDAACSTFTGTTVTTLATGITSFSITAPVGDPNYYTITMTLTGPEGNTFQLESAVRPRSKA